MRDLSKSKIFLICSWVFILGVAVASFLPIPPIENRGGSSEIVNRDLLWFSGVMASVVFLILFWKNKYIRFASLIGLALFLGIWRYSFSFPKNTLDKIWYYNGETIIVTGVVAGEPDIRQKNIKYNISAYALASPDRKVAGHILVTSNLYPRYDYGDELEITCELKAPEAFNDFSYDRYLARYDIYSVCYWPEIKLLSSNHESWFYARIFKLKNKLRAVIDSGLGEPEAGLARALILGDKNTIPADLSEKFSQTGISHIIAISGTHISILSGLVMLMLSALGFSRKHAFYFATAFLILYIFLIGLPASAMRAGLMGFLVLLALNLGRLSKLANAIVFSAAVLLLFNPRLLRDDIGFQLSFLAVLSIAYLYPLLDKWSDKIGIPKLRGARDALNITIAAQIFTFPIIAINFSQVSLIAPLANILILWIFPILMSFSLGAIVLSLIIPKMAILFFIPSGLFFKYMVFVVDVLLKIPFAYFKM